MSITYFVYILTNQSKTVLYVGVTRNMALRAEQHRSKAIQGFASQYQMTWLIYFETFPHIYNALGWSRNKKENLIKTVNPNWDEVSPE